MSKLKKKIAIPVKYHVKKDDEVLIISGAHKGKQGRVLQVLKNKARVIVEGVNLTKKAVRPTQDRPKGGFDEKEGTLHVSNVKVVKAAAFGGKKVKE
ncbi:MAG: 50S ribosomal protein L24 [Verrucomicrobiales bacterium]|jgi:large subunit ribosomal protein L24|nr:50S ribosomal protein L24 [Verrucomicrobiales bacterium]